MGQLLKDLREKKQNIIRLGMGRNNKMARGRSPSAQHLLRASPHPSPHPKSAFARRPGRAQTKREDDLTLKQKGGQITLARSYPKMSEILPSIRLRRVTAFY
jgi:uracil DNA glycosylase